MVLVRVVGDALGPGDGEEMDEGLVRGEGGQEVTHMVGCWESKGETLMGGRWSVYIVGEKAGGQNPALPALTHL